MNKLIDKVINNKKIFITVIRVLCLIIVGSAAAVVLIIEYSAKTQANWNTE